MNKRIEPELISITPDIDQVEAYKQSQAGSKQKSASSVTESTNQASVVKTSGAVVWIGIIAIMAFGAAGYSLYQQNLATKAQLIASEKRIAELERALSATGEEMGQSAGAIQAKLAAVATRTDELWTQMDKLWASAWRRNQAEIKELKENSEKQLSDQAKQISTSTSSLKALNETQTELALKMSLLQEQLQATETVKDELVTIKNDFDRLKSLTQNRDTKQVEIGASITQLEMTQKALVEQIERLEKRVTSSPPQPN